MIFRRKHNTTNEFNKNVELTRRLIQSNNELLLLNLRTSHVP